MDMKKLISVVTESAVNEQPLDMPMVPPQPTTPPVTMNMSLNAQGVEQIKELLKMMADASDEGKEEMPMPTVGMDAPLAIAPKEKDGGMDDLKALMKMAGTPEKEEYANEPDEKYSDIKAALPSGNDLHKEKRMFKKANGGDNAMAIESVRQMLDRRYKEIKEGKE
jgi:hypothetical protein